MSDSLREQLLKVGLVTAADVKKVEQNEQRQRKSHQYHQKKGARVPTQTSSLKAAVQQVEQAKAAKDKALNEAKAARAVRRQRNAEVRQLIQTGRVNEANADIPYSFMVEDKLKRVYVTKAQQPLLAKGQLAIILFDRHYQLVPITIAERVRELNPLFFIYVASDKPISPEYEEHPIPDDLMW